MQYIDLPKNLAEPLSISCGSQGFRGTPVGNHCSIPIKIYINRVIEAPANHFNTNGQTRKTFPPRQAATLNQQNPMDYNCSFRHPTLV